MSTAQRILLSLALAVVSTCPSAFADKSLSLLDDAFRLYNRDQFSKAIAEMDEAIHLRPNEPTLRLARAHIEIAAEAYKAAIEDCDAVIKMKPKLAGAYSRRGFCYCCLGKYDQGIADLSRSIDLRQLDISRWDGAYDYDNRAKAYRHAGKRELAEKDERVSLTLKAIDRARLFRQQIQISQAVAIMSEAIKKKPDDLYLHYFRGVVAMNEGLLEMAIGDFSFVMKTDPNSISVYYFRGDCYSRMHHHQEAINDFSKVIAVNPYVVAIADTAETGRCKGRELTYDETIVKVSDIYVLRALEYFQLKQFPQALADLNKATSMEPHDEDALQERADIYLAMKNYPLAIQECNKIIALAPKNWKSYEIRASVLEACKQPEKALADYTKVIALSGKDSGGYLLRGQLYDRLHQYEKAIADYSMVNKLNPDEDDAFRFRGDTYCRLGQYDKAVEDYSKAISLDRKGNIEAYALRAQVYEKLGRKDLALKDRQTVEQNGRKKL